MTHHIMLRCRKGDKEDALKWQMHTHTPLLKQNAFFNVFLFHKLLLQKVSTKELNERLFGSVYSDLKHPYWWKHYTLDLLQSAWTKS